MGQCLKGTYGVFYESVNYRKRSRYDFLHYALRERITLMLSRAHICPDHSLINKKGMLPKNLDNRKTANGNVNIVLLR